MKQHCRGAITFTAPSPRSLFGFRLARWGGSFCGVDLKSNEHDPEAFQLDDPVQLRGLRPGGSGDDWTNNLNKLKQTETNYHH